MACEKVNDGESHHGETTFKKEILVAKNPENAQTTKSSYR